MIKSLFSSASALQVHKLKMDVTAHNVANVNTNDFQSSRVTLQDSFSRSVDNARLATGQNQVGTGVSVASIDRNTTPGPMVNVNGMVETMGNTDLTAEIASMITAMRGLEANAHTFTTADETVEEIINLKND